MDQATLFAQLELLTGLSTAAWIDILSCTEDEQALILEGYAGQSWVTSPSTLSRVISILQIIGTIAGVVGGISGAAGAVKNLLAL